MRLFAHHKKIERPLGQVQKSFSLKSTRWNLRGISGGGFKKKAFRGRCREWCEKCRFRGAGGGWGRVADPPHAARIKSLFRCYVGRIKSLFRCYIGQGGRKIRKRYYFGVDETVRQHFVGLELPRLRRSRVAQPRGKTHQRYRVAGARKVRTTS